MSNRELHTGLGLLVGTALIGLAINVYMSLGVL